MIRQTRAGLWAGICLLTAAGCNQYTADRHNNQGTEYFQAGQVNQAINEYQKALIADPSDSDAYYNLGYAYAALGKQNHNPQWTAQGEQLFRQAISYDDQHEPAYRALSALMIETDREQAAFDLLNNWHLRHPTSPEPLIELARLYEEYGDNRRAADYLTDALRLDPNNAVAYKALGYIREEQGQVNLALENYMRSLQLNGSQTDVAQRVASLQQRVSMNPIPPTPSYPGNYGADRAGTASAPF